MLLKKETKFEKFKNYHFLKKNTFFSYKKTFIVLNNRKLKINSAIYAKREIPTNTFKNKI